MRPILGLLISTTILHGCGDKALGDTDTATAPTDSGSPTDTSPPDTAPCATPAAIFVDEDGDETDLTEALTTGEYTTLSEPGTLSVCPGTWFARLLLRADIDVVGLGTDRAETVLSGGESGTILDVGGPRQFTVRNLTLDRGAGLDVEHNSGGGGLYCEENGTVTIEDVTFSNGFANDGAGLYAVRCTVELTDTVFTDNLSEDDGGALTLWESTATLRGVTFRNNTALDGGAMALFSSDVLVEDSVIADNVASYFAGGIWQYDSTLSLRDVTLSGNLNSGSFGGGLWAYGSATLERVEFMDNAVSGTGGGLYVYFDSEVTGTDCDFSGNSPDDIWTDDYGDDGGVSHAAGTGYSFECAANTCSEK